MKNFMLGCNYWDSESGTDMWKNFSEDVVRDDIKALAACGVKYMRVFPNWRDFQPVQELYGHSGRNHGYADYDDQPLKNVEGINPEMIAHFRKFVEVCEEYDIKLMVSVVTGWMSGRLFMPQALNGKNLITDPDALMWEQRFIRGFVRELKDMKNIVMWDLGNESNCMGPVEKRSQAYVWTAIVRNAIRAEDPTREITSGMHSLASDDSGFWRIKDEGEITDYLTPHPYPSKTIHNDIDPANTARTTILPTCQCMFYSDLGGKPAILQEQGTFSDAIGKPEFAADFARANIFSAVIHNIRGWFWWCGMNHSKLTNAPYSWSMLERELGMLEDDKTPKKVGYAIKEMSELLDSLPFDEMPARVRDAVCVLTTEQYQWDSAAPAFVLGKQAGIEMTFVTNDDDIPASDLYIVPCITGWSVMDRKTQMAIFENVEKGATAYFSYDGAQFTRFETYFGMNSDGIVTSNKNHHAKFDFGEFDYHVSKEILADITRAEVLATNEEGNAVFTKFKYGKGTIFFLNMPLEQTCANTYAAYKDTDYYKIYQTVAKEILDKKIVRSLNHEIAVTLHPVNEKKYIVSAMNYTDKTQKCSFKVADGWTLTPVYGNLEEITKCRAAFYYAEKK